MMQKIVNMGLRMRIYAKIPHFLLQRPYEWFIGVLAIFTSLSALLGLNGTRGQEFGPALTLALAFSLLAAGSALVAGTTFRWYEIQRLGNRMLALFSTAYVFLIIFGFSSRASILTIGLYVVLAIVGAVRSFELTTLTKMAEKNVAERDEH